MLRYLTAGESHGPALAVIVDGVPAGLELSREYVDVQLRRRQGGYGRGRRMQIEQDGVEFLGGLRHGRTLGSPIAMRIANRDHAAWQLAMHPEPVDATELAREEGNWRLRPVKRPRPGHADLAGTFKFGFDDIRNVLERASARETAARVAAGAVARLLLEAVGIRIGGHVLELGGIRASRSMLEGPELHLDGFVEAAEGSPVRCADPQASQAMVRAIDQARSDGDTLGGIIEVAAVGVPPGLGSYTQWDRRLDGRLAQAFMSIPGIKGVEIGCGFESAGRRGSQVHDPIAFGPVPAGQYRAREDGTGFYRPSNRAGGLEGGVTTGQPVVVRAALKPLSTLMKPLPSVHLDTHEPAEATVERSDVCVAASAVVVGEAAMAWVLAGALLEKFGTDTVETLQAALAAYRQELARR